MRLFVPVAVLFVLAAAVSAHDDDVAYEDSVYGDAINFVNECGSKELSLCFKVSGFFNLSTGLTRGSISQENVD